MTAQAEASRLGDRIEVCSVFVKNGFQVLDCFILINLMLNVCGVCINARHLHTVRAWCANRGQAVQSIIGGQSELQHVAAMVRVCRASTTDTCAEQCIHISVTYNTTRAHIHATQVRDHWAHRLQRVQRKVRQYVTRAKPLPRRHLQIDK